MPIDSAPDGHPGRKQEGGGRESEAVRSGWLQTLSLARLIDYWMCVSLVIHVFS